MSENRPEKQQLHALVDRLPDSELRTALAYLQFLIADPVWRAILTAPVDDEPLEPELASALEAARARADQEGVPHEEILREFGLCP